jgi:hypothetical protein
LMIAVLFALEQTTHARPVAGLAWNYVDLASLYAVEF